MKVGESSKENQNLREFMVRSAEHNAKQKVAFGKLIDSAIDIDYKDPKIMRLIALGVPSQFRNIIWPGLMPNIHGITVQFYHSLINKAATLISANET